MNLKFISDKGLNLPKEINEDQKVEMIISSTVLNLSWLDINFIDNLEILTNLKIIHLSHNNIQKIENFDFLINLEYIKLDYNQINQVENLQNQKKLIYLDLSHNKIEKINYKQLPKQLEILQLNDNPIQDQTNYKKFILACLDDIQELNGKKISTVEKLKILGRYPKQAEEYEDHQSDKSEEYIDDDDDQYKLQQEDFSKQDYDFEESRQMLSNKTQSILKRLRLSSQKTNQTLQDNINSVQNFSQDILNIYYQRSKFSKDKVIEKQNIQELDNENDENQEQNQDKNQLK